ncbi:MAG: TIGR01777 family oxidoreductase [Verrucomicrobiales bacterium]|nr:TIGR01777 family oxidoreductase [Verrucomicrobiales bacterium]
MNLGITGITGLIGRQLARLATEQGHHVWGFSRGSGAGVSHATLLRQPTAEPWKLPEADSPLDTLIHLAGEPVLGLWTPKKRQRIRDSRVSFTEQVIDHLSTWKHPPPAFLCGSAVGFYGDRGDEILPESASSGSGFLAEVCIAWETAAARASHAWGARVVQLRTGLVLAPEGGALPLMRTAFRLGLGGRLGDGQQWMPWIHVRDEARLILHAATRTHLSGPLNLAAPEPARNIDFTRQLARTVHRPALLPAPAFLLKTLGGDMAQEMLLASQRIQPHGALESGFTFDFPSLPEALGHLLS